MKISIPGPDNALCYIAFQVIYLKGDNTSDMIALDPRWLCGSVCGHLLSQEFLETVKSSGCYTSHDFQLATPDWNSDNLLPVLEALGMCTQVWFY